MAEVTTTNPVNLYQLGLEIGGSPGFRMVDYGTTRTVSTSNVDQPTLDAAVSAHVADFDIAFPAPPSYPSAEDSLIAAARLIVLPKLQADELKDEAAEQFAGLFPDWQPGLAVKVGEVYRWDGTLVEVVQAHTTQADWTPDKVPALFKIHRTAAVAPWVQPLGAQDAYRLGERVTHNGQTWENTGSDANVWEPGVFGWTVVG